MKIFFLFLICIGLFFISYYIKQTFNKQESLNSCSATFILYKHLNGKIKEYMCYDCDELPNYANPKYHLTCKELFNKLKK